MERCLDRHPADAEIPPRSFAPTFIAAVIMNADAQSELDSLWRRSNLSAAQTVIWLSQKRHPTVPLHNASPALWIISVEVDRERLERAFQAVLDESDALRTVIGERDGIPCATVLPHVASSLELVDFSQAGSPMQDLRLWALSRSRRLFHFGEPMFDSALAKLSENQFAWYLNHHRIVADGWSTLLIFRKTAERYEALLKGQANDPMNLPKFADFIAHERRQFETPGGHEAAQYWREKLADPPPSLGFKAAGSPSLSTHRFRLSRDLGLGRSKRLREIAAGPAFTDSFPNLALFALFAGLFLTSLSRATGHRRLALGTPVSNRPSRKFQQTPGLLTHTVPMFIDLTEDETLVELARRARDEMVKVLGYQQYVPATAPPRQLYDALINYCHSTAGTFLGVPVRTESIDSGFQDDSQEKLAMQIRDFDASGSFVLDFDFRRDVFDEKRGAEIADRVLAILDSFLEGEQRTVTELACAAESASAPLTVGSAATADRKAGVTVSPPPSVRAADESPRTPTEEVVTGLWMEALGLERAAIRDDFFAVGGQSLTAVRLFAGIERTLGVRLPISTLLQAPTIAALSEWIDRRKGPGQWPSLVEIQRGEGGMPLFCAHGMGGEVLGFHNLSQHLDPRRPVYGLRAQGLDGQQPPRNRIEEMAAAYIREIRGVQPEGPYALVGLSFGGFVAFEIARQLASQGQAIHFLGLLDARKLFTKPLFLLNVLALPLAQKADFIRAAVTARAHEGELARRHLGTSLSAGSLEAQRRRIGKVAKGCFEAITSYAPGPFEGRITLFRALALLAPSVDRRLRYAWEELCQGNIDVHELPCDHWSVLREPHVRSLAQILDRCLVAPDAPAGGQSNKVRESVTPVFAEGR